jgi:hypothetical protein
MLGKVEVCVLDGVRECVSCLLDVLSFCLAEAKAC